MAAQAVSCPCGLVFITPQPSRSVLEAAYTDAYYAPWGRQTYFRKSIWRWRLRQTLRLASPPGRLLDVGCGTGAFLRIARDCGWDAQGTELSHDAVRAARTDGLPVIRGELWEVRFPPDTFDVVTCWHVIEHVRDPLHLMREILRILRPGGHLLLATPNLDDRIFRAAYLLARRRSPRLLAPDEREVHLFFFSARTLERLAREAGFAPIRLGFDRGAAATGGKYLVNAIAYGWYRLSALNWGMGLDLTARKPQGD